MSHYAVKITSGEIVYGTVDEDGTDSKMIVLNNPLVWEDYETEDGRMGSALVKYLTGSNEEKIPIAIASIVSMATMSETFSHFYDVAVQVQKITDESYQERLVHMTKKMVGLVIDYQNTKHPDDTGGIVFSPSESDTTIH